MYLLRDRKCMFILGLATAISLYLGGCRKQSDVSSGPDGDGGGGHASWVTDFEKAKQLAQAEGKDLLIDFSGSDWCGWCIKLDKEVFSKQAFIDEAAMKFVFVLVDFPRDTSGQSQMLQQQNKRLSEEFNVEYFPTVLLADSEGKVYAKTGYQEGGVGAYLEHLAELQKQK